MTKMECFRQSKHHAGLRILSAVECIQGCRSFVQRLNFSSGYLVIDL
jgi:hypothetical protein